MMANLLKKIQQHKVYWKKGIKVVTGGHPLELLDEDFAVMVKNPGIPYSNPMVEKALEKGIPVLTEVELAYLISDAPIIGITGSNRKKRRRQP